MIENNLKRLEYFLENHKVEGNEKPISHVSFYGGKYSIPLQENEEFLSLYLNVIKENKKSLYIGECFLPGKKIKLVLDIEIRPDHITGDISDDKIQNDILPKIVNTMTDLLKEKICIENVECIVSSRAPYLYHINFPSVFIGIKTAKNLVITCREIMEKHYQHIKWNKSIDTEIYTIGKGLRVLGSYSRKDILKNEHPFYRVLNENKPEEYLDISLEHLLKTSIRTEIDDDEIKNITSHQSEIVRHEEEIDNHDEIISAYIDEIRPMFKNTGLQIYRIKKMYYGNIDYPYFVVNLKDRFCPFVNREHKRKSDYLYVFITKNGTCLRCHNEECVDLKVPDKLIKLNTTIKNKYFQTFEDKPKDENIPEGYELDDIVNDLISKTLNVSHFDISSLVYYIYKDRFRVDTFGNKATWYEFKNHRFHADSNHLGILISEDLIYYFKKYKMEICAGRNDVIDDIVNKLKNLNFKNSIITEASNIFFHNHQDFVNLMDINKNLICFTNGILDLEKLEFRNGKIEDCITLCTRNAYLEYDSNHPKILEIKEFFNSIFVNQEVREYMLKKISLCLHGRGQEEFHIFTGNGCHSKGTEILMYDGTIKNVEDITTNDILMGDDSTPRNVLQLFRGHSDMYKICPAKGDVFTVNGDHDLAVKMSNTFLKRKLKLEWCEYEFDLGKNKKYDNLGNIYNKGYVKTINNRFKSFTTEEERDSYIKILSIKKTTAIKGDIVILNMRNYLKLKSIRVKKLLNIYKSDGIHFPKKEVDIDPYLFGYWLGDGNSTGPQIITSDTEIVDYLYDTLKDTCDINIHGIKDKAMTYSIVCKDKKRSYYTKLRKYNVLENKHIPFDYKVNSFDVRMKVLAGIIDSDGHYQKKFKQFELTLKSEKLIDDVIFLARSLGLVCYKKEIQKKCYDNGKVGTYFRIHIVGENLHLIPTIISRKKAEKRTCLRNPLVCSFEVQRVKDNDFFGFELDKNNLYLQKDFTVFKNSNGKSKVCELIKLAFGDYWNEMPVALITKPRNNSSSPSPEVMDLKGRRISTIQEPEMKDRLNMGLVKQFTGNDTISARQLHKKQEKFNLQTHLFLCCNVIPKIECSDGGTWRRIKIAEFKSKFVDNPDPNKDHEFKKDPFLDKKMASWGPYFLSLLVHYYKKTVTEGINEPAEIREFTLEFRKDSDFFAQFVDDCLIDDGKSISKFVDIFNIFENWCIDNNIRAKIYTKTEIKKLLRDLFGSEKAYKLEEEYIKGFKVGIRKQDGILSDEE